MAYIYILEFIFGVMILFGIIALMLKKKSNESVSLLWIGIALIAVIQGLFPGILDRLCILIGIDYPPILVVVVAIMFMLGMTFYLSTELSVSQSKVRELAIHISLLNNEMTEIKKFVKTISQEANNNQEI